MIIATLLLLGIPTLIFISLCTIFSSLILAVIKGVIEGLSEVCSQLIDKIGKSE